VAIGAIDVAVSGGSTLRDGLVLLENVFLVVVVDVDTETSWVNVSVTDDEKSTEDGLGQEIKDTIEDGLGVRRDDVATLTETPGNWVQEPEERGEGTAHEEDLANVGTDGRSVAASLPDENPEDVEESSAAKDEVSPLVGRLDESTNKTGDDHDLVDEDDPENGWPRHTSGQEEIKEKKWSGDEPVDVANVEDLTVQASNDTTTDIANELNADWGPAKVRTHGEIGDGGDHGNTSSNVVEKTVLAWLGPGKTDEGESCDGHDGADSPVPVGTVGGDGNVGGLVVLSIAFQSVSMTDDGQR